MINTLRECIRPGTKIRFTITVDETVTDLTVSDICQAVERFAQNYNQCFVEKFQEQTRYLWIVLYWEAEADLFQKQLSI